MRILFLALDVDFGIARGDSIHALSLATALARAGHKVHMVVGAAAPAVEVTGVEISVRPATHDPKVLRYVLRVAEKFRPDVIYERRFSPKISAAVSRLTGAPYVIEYNGIVEDEASMQGRPLRRTLGRRLKTSMRVYLLRRAAAVIVVTGQLRDVVVSDYGVSPDRTFVVENGVDPLLFRPMDRDAARQVLRLSPGPIVCFVGNLVAWQGLNFLLESLRYVPDSVRLLVVGDGPDRQALVELAKTLGVAERVDFVGSVPHSIVPTYVAAADICAAPFTARRNTRSGVSPLKLYEYLACARPVLVTAVAGAHELVEEFGCGVVVPPDDSAAMGAAIQRVLKDPDFPHAAKRASEVVRRDHSWDHVAGAVTRAIEIAVKPTPTPANSALREPRGEL